MSIAKFGRVYPALRSELWAYRETLPNPELRFGTPSSPTFSISNFGLVTSTFEGKDLAATNASSNCLSDAQRELRDLRQHS
jgi:hypothetical protein